MENPTRTIGVLILNTKFPRLPGDVGNPTSFNHPVIYQSIESATPATIVIGKSIATTVKQDIEIAATELTKQHVSIITTSCGFLSSMQQQLAQLSPTPVITSSLTLLPLLSSCHGGCEYLGVLTFDKEKLNTLHLGQFIPAAIEGLLESDSLKKTIAEDCATLDRQSALTEVLTASDRLLKKCPGLRAIILECTNLSPYKAELRTHTGLPVYDIVDAVHWMLDAHAV